MAKKISVLFWTISFNPNRLRQRKECHKFQDKQLNGPESSLIRIFQQINKMGKVLVFYVRSEGQIHGLDDDKVYLKDVAKSFQGQRIITERGTFKSWTTLFRENRRTLCEINASQFFQLIFSTFWIE